MKIDEMQKVCDLATPPPWDVDGEGREICEFDRYHEAPLAITDGGSFARNAVEHDAAFIALARSAMPMLLEVARKGQIIRAAVTEYLGDARMEWTIEDAIHQFEAAMANLDRL